jgi:hypothetical protein
MTTKTATTTPEPEVYPRYVLGANDGDRILLPDGLSCVPDKVQQLNAEAVRLRAAALLAGQQLNAAKAELAQAHGLDSAADRAASAAGRELPTTRVAEAATEALKLAERQHEGSDQEREKRRARFGSRDRQAPLYVAHRAVRRQQSIRDDLHVTLQQLSEQFDALQREGRVHNVLKLFPEQGSLHQVAFGRPGRFEERIKATDEADVAAKVANNQTGNMREWIPRQTEFLLAELRRQVGEA